MTAEIFPDWYNCIEPGVRSVVKLLRDNGFNTTCSCHHDMQVNIDAIEDGEFKRLHDLLINNGHRDYSLQWNMNIRDGYIIDRWLMLTLPGKFLEVHDDASNPGRQD